MQFSGKVAAVVFTKELKRLYITMKEGFPLEYTVDIPLDPFLFEAIAGAGVEVDLLQTRQIHYFLKPVGEVGETKSMYKDVVLGGDVWDLLDELMIYVGNPMQCYEKDLKFVRGVLLSGPPGTGKPSSLGHLRRKVGYLLF
ncbi:ATP-dependent zinc metalloprotease FTSH 12, chloroplastic-like isoform X7 [Olea europaea var. sylvestris]|uniref:ATP-dependent zinc metalloprotease FTSH 12, chloroplastic-like isoform X7 n=1 Tax=Olea europaea var. sylvestris TaxID=158386 RepID=UPI000C1CEC9F|nr:ATP-dependent zinc metalloprotease FTSH 12, chloroplastic-like isoform X7 [Olea europaea var. sylvestris]